MGEDLSCYLNTIQSVDLLRCPYVHWLANKAYFSEITVRNISQSFTHKMAAKASWNRNYVSSPCVYVSLLFYFLHNISSDFCQTNYLNIHRTDVYEICTDGRTLTVDEEHKFFFDSSTGRCHGNQFFVNCIHTFSSRYISRTALDRYTVYLLW